MQGSIKVQSRLIQSSIKVQSRFNHGSIKVQSRFNQSSIRVPTLRAGSYTCHEYIIYMIKVEMVDMVMIRQAAAAAVQGPTALV